MRFMGSAGGFMCFSWLLNMIFLHAPDSGYLQGKSGTYLAVGAASTFAESASIAWVNLRKFPLNV